MPNATSRALPATLAMLTLGAAASPAAAQDSLARYFGFDAPRFLVIDDDMGPATTADMDGDGRQDLIVVNGRKSRIEIHRQREAERTEEEVERDFKVNEFAPSRWFDKTLISVPNRVTAVLPFDVDQDGSLDLIYAGRSPRDVVVLRQVSPMTFEEDGERRINDLAPGQDGMAIADVMGDEGLELLTIVGEKIHVYKMGANGPAGEPTVLGSSGNIVAFFVEDFNGDSMQDILAVIPEDTAPLRLWLQGQVGSQSGKRGLMGAEIRFELPALVEVEPVRFKDRAAASIALIERASRRIVLYDVVTENVRGLSATLEESERDATARVYAFRGGADKDRSFAVADIDADGMPDLIATDRTANSLVLSKQRRGIGLGQGDVFSALQAPKTIAVGQWDEDKELEVFVLSEEEKVIGVADYEGDGNRVTAPRPLALVTPASTPVAMQYLTLLDGPAVAVIVKDGRDHTLEVHRPGGAEGVTVKLEGVKRPPQSMLAGDFDHDGHSDLALFTPSEPMVMVRSVDGTKEEVQVLTDAQMKNFGLVQTAGPDNTALFDADADGNDDLLIANKNMVRACTFSVEKGWDFSMQVAVKDAKTSLAGLAILKVGNEPVIVASDTANQRLILFRKDGDGDWAAADMLRITGFQAKAITAGPFAGDDQPSVLAFSDEGYALVRLGGQHVTLEEFAAYRADEEDLYEHEIEFGDINNDGFIDMVILESSEHECQVYTLSEKRQLHHATSFQVFETRLFEQGFGGRGETEPRYAYLADLTGDGLVDLTVAVHDRFIIYPQAAKK